MFCSSSSTYLRFLFGQEQKRAGNIFRPLPKGDATNSNGCSLIVLYIIALGVRVSDKKALLAKFESWLWKREKGGIFRKSVAYSSQNPFCAPPPRKLPNIESQNIVNELTYKLEENLFI